MRNKGVILTHEEIISIKPSWIYCVVIKTAPTWSDIWSNEAVTVQWLGQAPEITHSWVQYNLKRQTGLFTFESLWHFKSLIMIFKSVVQISVRRLNMYCQARRTEDSLVLSVFKSLLQRTHIPQIFSHNYTRRLPSLSSPISSHACLTCSHSPQKRKELCYIAYQKLKGFLSWSKPRRTLIMRTKLQNWDTEVHKNM